MVRKKLLALAITSVMLLGLASSCNKKPEETTAAPTTTTEATTTTAAPTPTEEPTTTTLADPTNDLYDPSNPNAVNPCTGVQDMDPQNVGNRSVAVSINNYYHSLPQRGITKADIIYEFETEAGHTRFIALFADVNTIPEVGSLRSARYMSCDLCRMLNTIFVHWGGNELVQGYFNDSKVDHVDGNIGLAAGWKDSSSPDFKLNGNLFFWRNSQWKSRLLEDTGMSNGEYIKKAIEYKELETKGESPMVFNFTKAPSEDIEKDGKPCEELTVYFSSAIHDAKLVYNKEKKVYEKWANGKPQIDETTGEQYGVTNVIVLFANIHQKDIQPDLRDASFTEGGDGYYLSNGKLVNFTWTQETKDDLFKFWDENGDELKVNIGKTYVAVVDNDVKDKTELVFTEDTAEETTTDGDNTEASETTTETGEVADE